MKKKIYVASPLSNPTKKGQEANRIKAIHYCHQLEQQYRLHGEEVRCLAPHAYLPLLLEDDIPEERELALQFGTALLATCEELILVGDTLTAGMKGEYELARQLGKPIYATDKSLADTLQVTYRSRKGGGTW